MTAHGLKQHIRGVPSGERVAVNLNQAHEIDHYSLAALVDEVAPAGVPVLLRGLCDGRVRMLGNTEVLRSRPSCLRPGL